LQNLSQVALSATGEVVCPTAADLGGCTCQEAWSDESGLDIDCREVKLNDATVGGLLKALLETGVSPAVTFDASKNNLTKVPVNLSKLSELTYIDMNDNQITSIPVGAFQSSSTKNVGIYLSNNRISSIAPLRSIIPPMHKSYSI